jgi:hypothetical protein
MRIFDTFEEFLTKINEEIRAEEAYREEESIKTVINGKRDLAYLVITEQKLIDPRKSISALREAINNGLHLIPLKGRDEGIAFIVYRKDKAKAEKFARFVEEKGGYLSDKTPEEARFIGQMLNYKEADIDEYIKRIYGE